MSAMEQAGGTRAVTDRPVPMPRGWDTNQRLEPRWEPVKKGTKGPCYSSSRPMVEYMAQNPSLVPKVAFSCSALSVASSSLTIWTCAWNVSIVSSISVLSGSGSLPAPLPVQLHWSTSRVDLYYPSYYRYMHCLRLTHWHTRCAFLVALFVSSARRHGFTHEATQMLPHDKRARLLNTHAL